MDITYTTSDPSERTSVRVETDDTLSEVLVEVDGVAVCLDPTDVGALTSQLLGWLAARAR